MTTPTTISIDGTDYVRADSIPTLPDIDPHDGLNTLIGRAVIIRTVTHYHTGRIVGLTADTIALDDAAWITDTGRWADCLTTGKLSEVEPFPGVVFVSRGAVVDVTEWTHDLPRVQK